MIIYSDLLLNRQRHARVRHTEPLSLTDTRNVECYLRWRERWERGCWCPDAHPVARPFITRELAEKLDDARAWLQHREWQKAKARIEANVGKVLVLKKRPAKIIFKREV